ncbi:MAG: hypothetical protein SPJ44_07405 [Treponema sp.]|nr:hypothetical protein [Treponema sp.]
MIAWENTSLGNAALIASLIPVSPSAQTGEVSPMNKARVTS